jgi:hypothetical protein
MYSEIVTVDSYIYRSVARKAYGVSCFKVNVSHNETDKGENDAVQVA